MLPSSLGELIHLRYLDVSRSAIKTLPKSLCKLSHLQTLKLEDCSKLTMLPNGMCNLLNLRHLDIRGTHLKEMPKGMGKLGQLHILRYYVMGKQEDNGIQELGGLLKLHGSFAIQKLENVTDANQARRAKIIDKKHIDELLLEWSWRDDMVSDIKIESHVLDSLQPHTGLKELTIKGYKGIIFPNWLGHCSYQNMTNVSLKFCKNCGKLPSLRQLPSLKSLRIEGFQLKYIGDEFYKNEDHGTLHTVPFPSLETLYFGKMRYWEVWNLPGCSEAFPQLKKLEIRECPKLKEDMSALMAKIIPHLTSLQEIRIDGFISTVSFPANCLPKSLQKLEFWQCTRLSSLSLDAFPNLKDLSILWCSNLESISMSEPPHTALQSLTISGCPKVVSITGGLAAPNLIHLDRVVLPPNLVKLCMKGYEGLLRGLSSMAKLEALMIYGWGCGRVKSFPEVGSLPHLPSLTTLEINGFDNLETLDCNELLRLSSLQHLHISSCWKL
ncbi:hypothetical protein PIB30_023627 [Stylosanthes scabra]|uniref:R13L1/DRL21-like LRR repeat region domain-containing protein n=1 Tax=Stylosanthes scabra TaxID=79078 RepID=A0ABU6Q999_9FABA|nr:hypothetical protein [Stylosanthes scabra]